MKGIQVPPAFVQLYILPVSHEDEFKLSEGYFFTCEEIAQLLAISPRAAYNLCNTTKDFRVLRIGTSIRVNKQSFDNWLAAV